MWALDQGAGGREEVTPGRASASPSIRTFQWQRELCYPQKPHLKRMLLLTEVPVPCGDKQSVSLSSTVKGPLQAP